MEITYMCVNGEVLAVTSHNPPFVGRARLLELPFAETLVRLSEAARTDAEYQVRERGREQAE